MPSVVQASIAAGQVQARETQTQNNLRTAQADRVPDGDEPRAADRGPASTLDVVADASRVTGGEAPLSATPGGGVQGTATDSSADRLAAGRDLNAPQADANTLTQELGALGVNAQANTGPAPGTGAAPGSAVLGAFGNPDGAPPEAGAGGPAPPAAATTAPGLTGVSDGGGGPPSDLAERPEPGDTVGG
jgi:hypothetical protein